MIVSVATRTMGEKGRASRHCGAFARATRARADTVESFSVAIGLLQHSVPLHAQWFASLFSHLLSRRTPLVLVRRPAGCEGDENARGANRGFPLLRSLTSGAACCRPNSARIDKRIIVFL